MRNEDKERYKLLYWVNEYQIADEIHDILIESGYQEAIEFVDRYFDGWGESEWIVSYFSNI